MSAEFWQYDARLGRRWNIDPVTFEWQSPYATFDNNPIYFADPLGAAAEKGHDPSVTGESDPYKPKDGEKIGSYTYSAERGSWMIEEFVVATKVPRNDWGVVRGLKNLGNNFVPSLTSVGNSIENGLRNANKWVMSKQGDIYENNNAEYLIKSLALRTKGALEINKYKYQIEIGIYSTGESNAGFYFSVSQRIGAERGLYSPLNVLRHGN